MQRRAHRYRPGFFLAAGYQLLQRASSTDEPAAGRVPAARGGGGPAPCARAAPRANRRGRDVRLVRGGGRAAAGVELVGVEEELRALRWVKTEEELALLRELAALTDWVQERYRENVRPAGPDRSSTRTPPGRQRGRLAGDSLVRRSRSTSPRSQGRTRWRRTEPAGRREPLSRRGTAVNIVVARGNGLVVENERMWVCARTVRAPAGRVRGGPSSTGGGGGAEPRNPVCSVDAAAQRVFEQAGYGEYVIHRTGHGMGTLGHDTRRTWRSTPGH